MRGPRQQRRVRSKTANRARQASRRGVLTGHGVNTSTVGSSAIQPIDAPVTSPRITDGTLRSAPFRTTVTSSGIEPRSTVPATRSSLATRTVGQNRERATSSRRSGRWSATADVIVNTASLASVSADRRAPPMEVRDERVVRRSRLRDRSICSSQSRALEPQSLPGAGSLRGQPRGPVGTTPHSAPHTTRRRLLNHPCTGRARLTSLPVAGRRGRAHARRARVQPHHAPRPPRPGA